MLTISRWKAAVMLFTVLFVSAMTVPNFLSEKTFQSLPRWAQHRIVPGIEFQGGTRLVLEVRTDWIRKEMVERLRDEVRRALREERVGLVQAAHVRGDEVHVRLRENDVARGFAILNERLVLPPQGGVSAAQQAPVALPSGTLAVTAGGPAAVLLPRVTIESAGDGLVRLALTESAVEERIQQGRRVAIDIIGRRVENMGFAGVSVERRGTDRIEVVAPGIDLIPLMHIQF